MATIKQKKAAKRMVENGGIASVAMLEVGYSPNTAKTPQKLTESEGFKEIWEELIPKRLVVQTHKKILLKTASDGQPHPDAVKGVDMAYKVDDAYAPEKHINLNLEPKANPIIEELAEKLNELLKQ